MLEDESFTNWSEMEATVHTSFHVDIACDGSMLVSCEQGSKYQIVSLDVSQRRVRRYAAAFSVSPYGRITPTWCRKAVNSLAIHRFLGALGEARHG